MTMGQYWLNPKKLSDQPETPSINSTEFKNFLFLMEFSTE